VIVIGAPTLEYPKAYSLLARGVYGSGPPTEIARTRTHDMNFEQGFCHFCPETQGSLPRPTMPKWGSGLVTPTQ
jgi:hypothetical protein